MSSVNSYNTRSQVQHMPRTATATEQCYIGQCLRYVCGYWAHFISGLWAPLKTESFTEDNVSSSLPRNETAGRAGMYKCYKVRQKQYQPAPFTSISSLSSSFLSVRPCTHLHSIRSLTTMQFLINESLVHFQVGSRSAVNIWGLPQE